MSVYWIPHPKSLVLGPLSHLESGDISAGTPAVDTFQLPIAVVQRMACKLLPTHSIAIVHYSHFLTLPCAVFYYTWQQPIFNSHTTSQAGPNAFTLDSPGLPTHNLERTDRIPRMPTKAEVQLCGLFIQWPTSPHCA